MNNSRNVSRCIECLKKNGPGIISYERIDYLCGSEEKGKATREIMVEVGVGMYEMGGFVLTEKANEMMSR